MKSTFIMIDIPPKKLSKSSPILGAGAPHKQTAKLFLEIGGIHFCRFELNQGAHARLAVWGSAANIAMVNE